MLTLAFFVGLVVGGFSGWAIMYALWPYPPAEHWSYHGVGPYVPDPVLGRWGATDPRRGP